MPSRTTRPPLAAAVLAALWVALGRCGVSGSPGPGCDSGKLYLDKDLPADAAHWDCSASTWPKSTQRHPSVDTEYDPDPARQICMEEPISYSHTIPHSGAYRPVRAESGEYLYCPPQRWLNNLHHGAVVLLYHPCVPLHERLLLSVLARSCLSDYILTPHPQLHPHMPIALVSWGRTLELSAVDPSDVCDWLGTAAAAAAAGDKFTGVNHVRKYDLLLSWPATRRRQRRTRQERRSANTKESLRRCCGQAVASRLSAAAEAELDSSVKKGEEGRSRRIRAAIRGRQESAKDTKERGDSLAAAVSTSKSNRTVLGRTGGVQSHNDTLGPSADPISGTLSDLSGQREALPPSKIQNQNQSPAPRPRTPLGSDVSRLKSESLRSGAPGSHKNQLRSQTAAPRLSPKHTDPKNTKPSADADVPAGVSSEHDHAPGPEALGLHATDQGPDSAKLRDSKESGYDEDVTADGEMKDNEVVDVRERELERKQTHSATHSRRKGEDTPQSDSPPHPQQRPRPPPAAYLPNSRDCDGCKAGERCDCAQAPGGEARAAVVNKGLPRTPRTDEAVWAAAALGFLLVLLTLSVLHTRLYRHWRTTPSLYWHDPRRDYDSVADVIRRRLRIAKRRRKRGRRQECVLLPSSSSSDELQ